MGSLAHMDTFNKDQGNQVPISTQSDLTQLKFAISPQPDDMYSRLNTDVTSMIGHESHATHFGHALEFLNYHLNMKLEEIDLLAFELLLTALSQANRFGSDLHICPVLGENSAIHTLRTLILDTEIARRAGNLSEESQADPEICKQRIRRLRSILSHDMGEIPGEQTSLASRTKNADTAELPDLEREIFRILLTEAYLTASSDTPRHNEFYKFQGMIRREIGNSAVSDAVSQHKLAIKIRELVARYDSDHASDHIPGKIARRIGEWLQDFDAIEIKDSNAPREALFVGYCAKAAEHIQGTRHLIRFGTIHPDDKRLNLAFPDSHPNAPRDHLSQANPEAMIPMRYTSNLRVMRNFRYMETELPHLFKNATHEHELRHARALRDMVYLTQIELLSVSRPILDRRPLALPAHEIKEDNYLVHLQNEVSGSSDPIKRSTLIACAREFLNYRCKQDLEAAKIERKSWMDKLPEDRLLALETRGRLQALYLHAIKKDYIPQTETPLCLLRELPASLHGFCSPRYLTRR